MNSIFIFFSSAPEHVWQELVLDSLVLPMVFLLFEKLKKWFNNTRPLSLLLKGIKKSELEVLIYLSQLSVADDNFNKVSSPKYIAQFPNPLPTNRLNVATRHFQNIDPIWSESDGVCSAEILNLLGRAGNSKFRIADTSKDWDKHLNPKFTIGFNPKTHDLIKDCSHIYFNYPVNSELQILGNSIKLGCQNSNDAGIIQKTYVKNTKIPVFILAGLGVMGTEVSGNILNKHCVELGKLYGKIAFCLLFSTDITKGKEYFEITAAYPKIPVHRIILYPVTSFKWYKKNIFPSKQ